MDKYCPQCSTDYASEVLVCPQDGTKLVSVKDNGLVGKDLDGRYTVHSKLGEGGMGVVYIAEQTMVGRKVALKVLRKDMVEDKSLISRFFNEAKAIAALKSAHTITLYDFGVTDDGLLYYTMELLEGKPLSGLIARGGPVPWHEAVSILLHCLDSLEEAHDNKILHRDIKPDNIFITDKKGNPHATVLDFGIAKLMGDNSLDKVTKTGMICGTPAYLSPEQALGNAAVPASDLYSLSIVFYEMLSGSPPFCETTPMKVLLKHLNERPELISIANPDVEVPARLDEFLQRALEKKPDDRFHTVGAFRDGLGKAVAAHEMKPETVQLSSITTSSAGLRAITERFAPEPVKLHDTRETPAVAPEADLGTASTLPQTPATSPGAVDAVDGIDDTLFATPDEGLQAEDLPQPQASQKKPVALFAGIGALAVALIVTLVVWQPWVGSGNMANPPGEKQEAVQKTVEKKAPPPVVDEEKAEPAALEKVVESTNVQARKAAEERARTDREARLRAEGEARKSAEELASLKAEAKAEAEAEAKAKAEAKAEAEAEAKAEAKAKAEAEAKAKAEAEAEAEAKAKAEAEAKAKAEAEAKAKAEAKKKAEAARKRKRRAKDNRPVRKGGAEKDEEDLEFKDTKVKIEEKKKPVEKPPVKEEDDEFDFKEVEVK